MCVLLILQYQLVIYVLLILQIKDTSMAVTYVMRVLLSVAAQALLWVVVNQVARMVSDLLEDLVVLNEAESLPSYHLKVVCSIHLDEALMACLEQE